MCRYKDLKRYIENAVEVDPDRPVLVDKYLDRADELDVDALCDKDGNVVIAGIMQHIEQAGVHSGAQTSLHVGVCVCLADCCSVVDIRKSWMLLWALGQGHAAQAETCTDFCRSAQAPVL